MDKETKGSTDNRNNATFTSTKPGHTNGQVFEKMESRMASQPVNQTTLSSAALIWGRMAEFRSCKPHYPEWRKLRMGSLERPPA